MKKSISITLNEDTLTGLKSEAESLGMSVSSLIEKKLTTSTPPSPSSIEVKLDEIKELILKGGLKAVIEEVIESPIEEPVKQSINRASSIRPWS